MSNDNTTALAVRSAPADIATITGDQIDTIARLASNLAASGFFKDARKGEEAFAKLIFGRDLGLGATQALTEIHIVEGKPELSANLQASMVRLFVGPEGERYDFRKPEHTTEKCVLVFRRKERGGEWEDLGDSTFTIEDAKTAGLVRANSPWVKYPRNMLFARAMSNGVAWYCPEVTGGVRVYSPGELGGEVPPPPPEPQVETAAVEATAVEDEPPVDAEVVPDAVAMVRDLANDAVKAKVITKAEVKLLLTANGARDASDITTLPPEGVQAVGNHLMDLMPVSA